MTLSGPGAPNEAELRTVPRHKKNPDVGTKEVVYSTELFIEQIDAQSFVLNQEVRLSFLLPSYGVDEERR